MSDRHGRATRHDRSIIFYKVKIGNALQPLFEKDLKLHTSECRTNATVEPRAKAQTLGNIFAGKIDLHRIRKAPLIEVSKNDR